MSRHQEPRYTWTIDGGRALVRDGITIATLGRVGNDSAGHALAPWEADALARRIVACLIALDGVALPDPPWPDDADPDEKRAAIRTASRRLP